MRQEKLLQRDIAKANIRNIQEDETQPEILKSSKCLYELSLLFLEN